MGIKRCRLERYQQIKLLEMFVAQVTARTAADLVGVNYHTAHLFYHKLREIITAHLEAEWPFDGEVEVDESYFGGVRKGTRVTSVHRVSESTPTTINTKGAVNNLLRDYT